MPRPDVLSRCAGDLFGIDCPSEREDGMAVVLDTQLLDPEHRVEAIRDGFRSAARATWMDVTDDAQIRLEVVPIADGIHLIDCTVSAERLAMRKVTSRGRGPQRDYISVNITDGDGCRTLCRDVAIDDEALRMVDTTSDYELSFFGACRSIAVEVDYARIGLSVDVVRSTMMHIGSSPLSGLLSRHLVDVADISKELSPTVLGLTGSATADLIRATILSISSMDSHRSEALSETLPRRVEEYIRHHLSDSDLTPARIAEAHHISLRYLYKLLAGHAETPAEWIMTKRLEAARAELVLGRWSVSATAHRWGFKDHSHFSRRFKAAYGITPTEFIENDLLG
jgi:AraC-like DNA-binding protein